MTYIAHKIDKDNVQTVKAHLEGTAKLAKGYAADDFKELAYSIGLAHDIGKYSLAFQRRIKGSNERVEHSISGAIELEKLYKNSIFRLMAQYCISGHHTGLPDGGTRVDNNDKATLQGRMKRIPEDYSAYSEEIEIKNPVGDEESFKRYITENVKGSDQKEVLEIYAFLTRYIFSCLKDADYIDTERFCNKDINRGLDGDFDKALTMLDDKIAKFLQKTKVQKARSALQNQAISNAVRSEEIKLLNMPTGSGKTLCSIKIALEQKKKRIIYVIPYTSIIEQTADTFEKCFGKVLPVLQHHSNYSFDEVDKEEDSTQKKLKATCENWDAPLIVTTSVQFFQSLYHHKGSRLRKLHNLSDSVIIFDEIHLIPMEYLVPCLKGIGYITKMLNSTAIFLSATMPDYAGLIAKYLPQNNITELITDKSRFSDFENCKYQNLGKLDFDGVVEKSYNHNSSLIIVNSRKSARLVYEKLKGNKYHLSTYMTPSERSKAIAEIKDKLNDNEKRLKKNEKLQDNEKITVVSTSLVEAGVDFDFEAVFRELAGLDSILQAGGRCNREGNKKDASVFIFESGEKLHGDIAIRANITLDILKNYNIISSEECIKDYYNRLLLQNKNVLDKNCITNFDGCAGVMSIPFRSYSENFEYIKSDTIGIVVVLDEKSDTLINRLEKGDKSVIRSLQRYTVSVYYYEFEEINKMGILKEIEGVYMLANNCYYRKDIGLAWKENFDDTYII